MAACTSKNYFGQEQNTLQEIDQVQQRLQKETILIINDEDYDGFELKSNQSKLRSIEYSKKTFKRKRRSSKMPKKYGAYSINSYNHYKYWQEYYLMYANYYKSCQAWAKYQSSYLEACHQFQKLNLVTVQPHKENCSKASGQQDRLPEEQLKTSENGGRTECNESNCKKTNKAKKNFHIYDSFSVDINYADKIDNATTSRSESYYKNDTLFADSQPTVVLENTTRISKNDTYKPLVINENLKVKNLSRYISWLGFFKKLLPKRVNPICLPDDINPSIVWDSTSKCWIDKDKCENTNMHLLKKEKTYDMKPPTTAEASFGRHDMILKKSIQPAVNTQFNKYRLNTKPKYKDIFNQA